jgi:hypothetical protein
MTVLLDADAIDRTALLGAMDGTADTLDDALNRHNRTGLTLAADASACATHHGQAALLTATATAVRAFGSVIVHLDGPDSIIETGTLRGMTVGDAVACQGAHVAGHTPDIGPPDPTWPTVLIGPHTRMPACPQTAPAMRAWWNAWTAHVAPADLTPETPPTDDCVLAAVAAGGLAVAEAFGAVRALPGSDAGYRHAVLDLWAPTGDARTTPPPLQYAPYAWWLVGLGHLGQAFAWTISWLPYENPHEIEIIGQDTQTITASNISTGILTARYNVGAHKTRIVAGQLEAAGHPFRVIERQLTADLRALPAERHVALLGVDNLDARKLVSDVGWALAIDVGLGATPNDFTAIALHRFPSGRRSDQIPAWQGGTAPTELPDTPAFADLANRHDRCGVVELAGKAVGAAFVGIVASCLAVAEACRELAGGPAHDVLHIDVDGGAPISAPALTTGDVISARLRNPQSE